MRFDEFALINLFSVRTRHIHKHFPNQSRAIPLVSSHVPARRVRVAIFRKSLPNRAHLDHGGGASVHREFLPVRGDLFVHPEYLLHFSRDLHRRTARRTRLRQHLLPHEQRRPGDAKGIRDERCSVERQRRNHFRWLSRHSHAQLDLPTARHRQLLSDKKYFVFKANKNFFYRKPKILFFCRLAQLKLHPANPLPLLCEFKNQMDRRWTRKKFMEKFVICIFYVDFFLLMA